MPTSQGNVQFKFGSLQQYNALAQTGNIDENTWYIITDPGNEQIYIGFQLFVDRSTPHIWEVGTGTNTAVQAVISAYKGTATATGAVSMGRENDAKGIYSMAQGWNTSTESSGTYSHSEGLSTKAAGSGSHSEGQLTIATGQGAHAEGLSNGDSTIGALGNYSHVEGYRTTASGKYSHAEGYQTVASPPQDSNGATHAEGYQTTASGVYSHAEGQNNVASGQSAHAEGSGTKASGNYSHAEGGLSEAKGNGSHASGQNTVAYNNYMTSAGKFNKYDANDSSNNDSNTVFVVGVGTADNSRLDGLKVNSTDGAYNSASSSGMGGSVAVNKFSANSINTPSFNGTALVLLYIDSGYMSNVDIYLGTSSSGYFLTDNSANGTARYYRSYQILKSKLSFYRTDSSGASIYIYGDGTFVDNLLDGGTVNLTNTSYNLIEISTSQLY